MRPKVAWLSAAWTSLAILQGASVGATCLSVSVPASLEASAGDLVDVPILVAPGFSGTDVIGFLVALTFDTSHVQFQEIRDCVGGVVYPSSDWKPFTFNVIGSELRIAASSAVPLAGSGCLFVVRFRILGTSSPSTCSPIHLKSVLFNAGTPCTTLIDGEVCTACR